MTELARIKAVGLGRDTTTDELIYIDAKARQHSLYIIGMRQYGKSNLLEHIAWADMANGDGLLVIDPLGKSADKLMQFVPEERREDVIFWDVADPFHLHGFNPFFCPDPVMAVVWEDYLNGVRKAGSSAGAVIELVGPRYQRLPEERRLYRWGSERGSVYLADQKVPVRVPRVRDVHRNQEVRLELYDRLQEPRGADAQLLQRILRGLGCRNYRESATLVPEAFGMSASTVSRRFIRATSTTKGKLISSPAADTGMESSGSKPLPGGRRRRSVPSPGSADEPFAS
jgi:hypothetical protein